MFPIYTILSIRIEYVTVLRNYFSSDAAPRALPSAMILLAAAAVLAAILA